MRVLLAIVALLFLTAAPAWAQSAPIQNPSLIVFTPSPDHATISSYQVVILDAKDAAVQTLDIGKPNPCSASCPAGVAVGEASAAINVQPVAFGRYTVVMKSVGGGITGPASPPSDVWERAPGSPSKPKVR